jgi:hypothetical protein
MWTHRKFESYEKAGSHIEAMHMKLETRQKGWQVTRLRKRRLTSVLNNGFCAMLKLDDCSVYTELHESKLD